MTDSPENYGPPDAGRFPANGSYIGREWLPIGVALLALAVAIAALVIAVDDSDSDDHTAVEPESSATATAPAPATTQAFSTTTLPTVQTLQPSPTTTAAQQVVTATSAAESDEMSSEGAEGRMVLAVVGIGHDSTLNVRETPGGAIVGKLESLATGIVPTGTTREVSGVTWHEVHATGVVGWVSGEYLAPLGATYDATSQIMAILGEVVRWETMTDMGRSVAGAVASTEPESRVRNSGAGVVSDVLGEITMDIVGQPDDSIRGFRLRIVATPGEEGESFILRSVEGTVMCYTERGVSAEGLCH
ncbi:hypothetical protein [Candidatus Poriferisodalis sp.]|uniref:hypothetical protein n=1 Tax=Candidatus Poriferisodalis sp. TaxID=3101277 RepID=UPI003C6EDDB2